MYLLVALIKLTCAEREGTGSLVIFSCSTLSMISVAGVKMFFSAVDLISFLMRRMLVMPGCAVQVWWLFPGMKMLPSC